MSAAKKINLLSKDTFESSFAGKLVKWAVSVGRWIVVFTEFIVICAFLSRFYFDTELANLFDDIKQKQAMVSSASYFEENFRQIQEKTKIIKNILTKEEKPSTLLTEINKILPQALFINKIWLEENTLTLSGYTNSESSLNAFVTNLNNHPKISQVNLAKVASLQETITGINFSITADRKK